MERIPLGEIESHVFDDMADVNVRKQYLVELLEHIGMSGEGGVEIVFPNMPTIEEIRQNPVPLVRELLGKWSWGVFLQNINTWRAEKGTGRGKKPWQVFSKEKHFIDKLAPWLGVNHRGEEVDIVTLNIESARMLRDLVRDARQGI